MSAVKLGEDFQFMDDGKKHLCETIMEIVKINKYAEDRIQSILNDFGYYFIEQLNKPCLSLILEMEKSILNGVFSEVFMKKEFALEISNCFNAG